MAYRWVVGIDEAGRGPLAGPVGVGAVALPAQHARWLFWAGLRDSKKLTGHARALWLARIKEYVPLRYAYASSSAALIDRRGISVAANIAACRALGALHLNPEETLVQLDYGLSVGEAWESEAHIKGDERFPAIALASIVAKEYRDAYVCKVAPRYPEYGFENHKGYGTPEHRAALRTHGPCKEHRATFIRRVLSIPRPL